jgi:hypothetical protein
MTANPHHEEIRLAGQDPTPKATTNSKYSGNATYVHLANAHPFVCSPKITSQIVVHITYFLLLVEQVTHNQTLDHRLIIYHPNLLRDR